MTLGPRTKITLGALASLGGLIWSAAMAYAMLQKHEAQFTELIPMIKRIDRRLYRLELANDVHVPKEDREAVEGE